MEWKEADAKEIDELAENELRFFEILGRADDMHFRMVRGGYWVAEIEDKGERVIYQIRQRPIGTRVYVYDVNCETKYLGNCASLEDAKELCYDNATDPSVWEPGMGDV